MAGDKNNWLLVGLLVLFVATRIIFLFFAYPHFFWDEDLFRGVLAKEVTSGKMLLPLYDYQIDHYSGGSLVVGLLAVPFFWAFGPSAFSLKLVGLLFFAAILLVWYRLCLRYFSRTTAVLFSLLFIFSPLYFSQMSLLSYGFHSESMFFTALTIFIFYEIFFSGKRSSAYFSALGLSCGLGLWFTYIFGITVLCVLICWFFHEKGFLLRKSFLIFCAGFLLGLAPWIIYNIANRFQGLIIHRIPVGNLFTFANLIDIFPVKKFVMYDIPASMNFGKMWFLDKRVPAALYFLTFIIAFFFLIMRTRGDFFRSKVFFFICYGVLLCLSYQSLVIHHAVRYLIVLYPFIFIAIALLLERLISSRQKVKKIISVFILLLLLFISGHSTLGMMSGKYAGYGSKARGYSYLRFLLDKHDVTLSMLPKYLYIADNLEAPHRDILLESFCDELELSQQDIDKFLLLAEKAGAKHRWQLYRRLGNEIGVRFAKNEIEIEQAKKLARQVKPPYRRYVYKGWVESTAYLDPQRLRIAQVISEAGEEFYPYFYDMLGRCSLAEYLEVASPVDKKYVSYFYEGVGGLIISNYLINERYINIADRVAAIDKRYQPSVLRGIGKYMALLVYCDPANMPIWNRLLESFSDESNRNYCREGFTQDQPEGRIYGGIF